MPVDIHGGGDIHGGSQTSDDLIENVAQLQAMFAETAGLDSLFTTTSIQGDTAAGSNVTRDLFIAPFPLAVKAFAFVQAGAGAGSNVNNWTFTLQRARWNGTTVDFTTIARKSNWNGDPLGGEQFIAHKAWTMDAVSWDNAAATFNKDDVLTLSQASLGAPSALSSMRFFTTRYEPI